MSNQASAYPYPVLRNWMDDYSNSRFDIEVGELGKTDQHISVPYALSLKNDYLAELIIDKGAFLALEVICKSTLFHDFILIDSFVGELEINSGRLAGLFSMQAFLISSTSRKDFKPSPINGEYAGSVFELKSGDVVAESEIIDLAIDFNRKSAGDSIEVRHVDGMKPFEYEVDAAGNNIVISTGEKAHYYYLALRGEASTKAHLYQSMYKDAVLIAIETMIDDPDSHELTWAKGLLNKMSALNLDLPLTKDVSQINKLALEIIGPDGMGKVRGNVS